MGITTRETLQASTSGVETARYVYNDEALRRNIDLLNEAFKAELGESFSIAYSFKTNYFEEVIKTVKDKGCYAEVVSPYEYAYAIDEGFPPDKIVYNGVIPTEYKFDAIVNGSIVNIESVDEYLMLSKMAKIDNKHIEIGIRVTFDVGNGIESRFGVPIDDGSLDRLMALVAKDTYVNVVGFHCHIGSARGLNYWIKRAKTMASLAYAYDVKYLDLGGGLYGYMPPDLAKQFPDYCPSFNAYAEGVCKALAPFARKGVKIFVEPGTALVGNTMDVIAHVTNIKRNGTSTYIVVDCPSSSVGFICDCKDISTVVHRVSNKTSSWLVDATIVGNSCLEFDYLKRHVYETVNIGDEIEIKNVGAYSISCARQFITPTLPVYDTKGKLLKPAEEYVDMFRKQRSYAEN